MEKIILITVLLLIYSVSQAYGQSWRDVSGEYDRNQGSIVRIDENIEKQSDGSIIVRYETGHKGFDLMIPHKIKINCSNRSVNYLGSFNMRNVSDTVKSKIHRDIMTVFKSVCPE